MIRRLWLLQWKRGVGMEKNLIYVVDDEAHICELIEYNLKENGYQVRTFPDGKSFLAATASKKPDLILLDIMLPEMSGLEICKKLKSDKEMERIPVVFLTAKNEEIDKVLGLELGADDYISKPFGIRELLARVKTVLRRCGREQVQATVIAADDIVIDTSKHKVKKNGVELTLTLKEFELLKYLISHKGHVLTREVLLDRIWGYDYFGETRTVDVHIRQLRKLLGDHDEHYIETVRGVGYRFHE